MKNKSKKKKDNKTTEGQVLISRGKSHKKGGGGYCNGATKNIRTPVTALSNRVP